MLNLINIHCKEKKKKKERSGTNFPECINEEFSGGEMGG